MRWIPERSDSSISETSLPPKQTPSGASSTFELAPKQREFEAEMSAAGAPPESKEVGLSERIISGTVVSLLGKFEFLLGEFEFIAPEVPSVVFSSHGTLNIKEAWQLEIEKQLEELLSLPDNFDTEGSPHVSPDIVNLARQVIDNLYRSRGIKCTQVFPTSHGGVEIEIDERFWEAGIWIDSANKAEFIVKIGGKRRSGSAVPGDLPEKIWEALG
jgi:hypothetical protein